MSTTISEKITSKLLSLTELSTETELQKWVKTEMNSLKKISEIGIEAMSQEYTKQIIACRKTKRRWIDKENDLNSSFHNEIDEATKTLTGENGIKHFHEKYEVEDLYCLREKIINSMEEWAANDDLLLIEFKYFKNKQAWQKKKSLGSDIKILCLRYLIEEIKELNKPQVITQLKDWSNVPVDFTGRGRFQEISLDDDSKKIGIMKLDLPGGTEIEQKLTIDSTRNKLYKSPLIEKLLDGDDMSIMRFVLSKLRENKYISTEIKTTKLELIQALGLPLNGRSYELITASIVKLSGVKVFVNSPSGKFDLGFLANFELPSEENGEVILYLDNAAYKQALSGKVISMYKNVIYSLSSSASAVIYKLQMERVERHAKNLSSVITVDISYFKSVLIINSKRKDRIHSVIENALDEILNTGVTLKAYTKITDGYYELEFLPLTKNEMTDLVANTDIGEQFAFLNQNEP